MGIVQTKQGSASSGTTWPFTLSITLDNPTAAGNSLVVLVAASGVSSNPTSIACKLGGVLDSFVQDSTFGSSSDAAIGATWRDQPCAGGQTVVAITASSGSNTPAITATVYEVDDLDTSPFDKAANSVSGGSTSWTSTATPATSQADERLFGGVFTTASGAGTITGPSSPWANLAQVSQAQGSFDDAWMSGWQDVAATGAYTYAGTVAPSSQWISKIVTYKIVTGTNTSPAYAPRRRPGGGRSWVEPGERRGARRLLRMSAAP